MSSQEELEKLRKKAEEQGLNISDDALFVVSELRSELRELIGGLRGLLLWLSGIMIGLIVGFGVAILSLI